MLMIRLPLLTLMMALAFFKNGFAQKSDKDFQRFIALRTNLLSFAELNAGIMIGARFQWTKKFSATIDPTFIFFNPYINRNSDQFHPLGIKIRADVRYHFDIFFIAPELHFKKVTTRKWSSFGINCTGQNCDFFMLDIYREQKTESGVSVKAGLDLPLDKKNRLSLEIYGGLGIKYNYYKRKSIPTGGSFFPTEPRPDNLLGIPEGNAIPIMPASLKISYRLR